MSIKVMTVVWDAFPASGSELLAMLALADWCDDNGGSLFPSIKSVADKIRVSESQARRILRGFETGGYLTVVGNHSGGAPGMTRKYRLNVASLKKLAAEKETGGMDATPSADAQDGLHGCAGRVAPMRGTGGMDASLTTSEPPVNPQEHTKDVAAAPVGENPVFAEIWSCYPKRPGASRADSLKAFNARIKDGADPKAILEGVKRYAAYCVANKTEPRFIKQAVTFLGPGLHYESDWGFDVAFANAGKRPVFDPYNPDTWGFDDRGRFNASLYSEDETKAYFQRKGIESQKGSADGGVIDMGDAEVVQ